MVLIIFVSAVLALIFGRIFLQKNELIWLFCVGSAIVVFCINSVRESLLLEWDQYGITKDSASLFFALLCITVQFFWFRKPGLRFFNAVLAFIIIQLTPFLSPELQISNVSLQLSLLSSHLTLLDISYKLLFVGSSLISLLLLLLLNKAYWDVPRYSLDFLSEKERKELIEKFTLERVKKEYAAQNEKIRTLSKRIITDIDEVSYRLVGFGHFLLTLANLVGCIWSNDDLGSFLFLYLLPAEFWSLITWLIFTLYLYVRLILAGTKLQTSWVGFGGFISVCISFYFLILV